MRIFAEKRLSDLFVEQHELLKDEVLREPKNRLLNVNEVEYRDYLVGKYEVEPLNFLWEQSDMSDSERMIPAESFPPNFNVVRGKRYPRPILTLHVPFIGDQRLFEYQPSPFVMWTAEVEIKNGCVNFEIVDFNSDAQTIKAKFGQWKANVQRQHKYVMDQVVNYNTSLPAQVEYTIQNRKRELLRMANLLESIGVPVRKTQSTPYTFSVPFKKTTPIIKPNSSDKEFSTEPTLDESVYREILNICQHTGVEMERHPSIYFDKNEETLRDHFLMVLSPHFESVTGETFNKKGKTDILIRHENKNVFVAECKFWTGQSSFHSTLRQILGYLTWRDSKAAIFFFVRNKDIHAVISSTQESAITSDCFVAFNGSKKDGWLDFDFKLASDNPRNVRLAVLFFHFPRA